MPDGLCGTDTAPLADAQQRGRHFGLGGRRRQLFGLEQRAEQRLRVHAGRAAPGKAYARARARWLRRRATRRARADDGVLALPQRLL